MIQRLIIKNYVLIDLLEIDFKSGFTSITGETGAGKSIILGALSLLTGSRSDTSVIRVNSNKCIIEAEFTNIDDNVKSILIHNDIDIIGEDCIIRREISHTGKSRAFVNDTPCSLSVLKELGEFLIDIHSQHKNLLLGNTLFQLSVLDLYAGNNEILKSYKSLFLKYKDKIESLNKLKEEIALKERDREYIEFQLSKLIDANLIEGEEVKLDEEYNNLSHALDIKRELNTAISAIEDDESGALNALNATKYALRSVSSYSKIVDEYYDRIESLSIELDDILRSLSDLSDDISYDPDRLDFISDRLDTINNLLSRHNALNTKELLDIQSSLSDKLNFIDNSSDELASLEKEIASLFATLQSDADKLHKVRTAVAKEIEKNLVLDLKELGMPFVKISIDFKKLKQLGNNGYDQVDYLFTANKETEMKSVSDIASGGEISRLMLSIKSMIAGKKSLPTIIFDEIDTGVSGDIAEKIGRILQNMGNNMQVLAVTHLPQIAASGDNQIYIYKEHLDDSTHTRMKYLDIKERIDEIARMQSGNNLTDISRAAAQQLLKQLLRNGKK